MKADEISQMLALARTDLAVYATAMFPGFELAAHHRIIVDKLEQVERGQIKRLMVFTPPRHGKSLTTTQLFPSWWLGRHPDQSVITACYGQELADGFGRRVRNFVTADLHKTIFPECLVSADSSSMGRFDTTRNGAYFAAGRGASITGRGAHLLIIDDPLSNREEANSETVRRSLHEWYSSVAYTRLQPGGAVVIVQTRWHMDDLAGRLLREQPGEWEVLSLPAIAETDETFRKTGEALWPEKYPLPVLEEIRTAIGSAAFVSLYQQRPVAAGGGVFKSEWFQTYREIPPAFRKLLQSWDTAFQSKTTSDYSVCTTWGVTATAYYLLHVYRERVEFPELKRAVEILADQWRPGRILIEDRASGQSLIQELRNSTRFPVLPIKADTDKRSRAEACTGMIEAGRVFVPESAPWLETYLDELASFPSGLHDDQVDSTTQALNYLRQKRGDYATIAEIVFGGSDSGYSFVWDK